MLKDIKDVEGFESKTTEENLEIAPNIDKLCTTRWTVCVGRVYKKIMDGELLMKL